MPQIVPPVPGIPAGWAPFPADFTTWVTQPFSFLATPAVFRAQLQASKSIPANAWTLCQLDTVLEDPYGGWSATANPSQGAYSWLCPPGAAGWYDCTLNGFATNQGSSTAQLGAGLWLNGSEWSYGPDDWAVNGNDSGTSGAVQVYLAPGDYVQLYLVTTDSASTPATAGQYPSMELAWVSS